MIETLDASIPASRGAYLLEGAKACGWKIFWYPIDVVVSQLPAPPSLLRDAWSADKKKNARRVNTMARSKTILDFFGIVAALWEQLPPSPLPSFPSCAVTLGAACRRDKFHP